MPLIGVDVKDIGVDPRVVADILARVDTVTKRLDWLSLAAVSITQQLGEKFSLKLPPPPQG